MIEITTESGSVYEVTDTHWRKVKNGDLQPSFVTAAEEYWASYHYIALVPYTVPWMPRQITSLDEVEIDHMLYMVGMETWVKTSRIVKIAR